MQAHDKTDERQAIAYVKVIPLNMLRLHTARITFIEEYMTIHDKW